MLPPAASPALPPPVSEERAAPPPALEGGSELTGEELFAPQSPDTLVGAEHGAMAVAAPPPEADGCGRNISSAPASLPDSTARAQLAP